MEVGKTLYVTERGQWRAWLEKNHDTENEIWLVFYRKSSGKPRLPYNDAVEEALCFGWIDSTVKSIDEERLAQRFSPRRSGSPVSEMNKERIRRLVGQGKMTAPGLETVRRDLDDLAEKEKSPAIAPDILDALKGDPGIWKNFQGFPDSYKRIRIGWIEGARKRPNEFRKRLDYFLRMTAKNKRYGMVQ
jgi:uncharacterized protein YdeI (YjbR/CyaY-like superfamily)